MARAARTLAPRLNARSMVGPTETLAQCTNAAL